MASDINVTVFTGRVVANPEARGNGKTPVASFAVAINRSVRQPDGSWTDGVDFVDVSCSSGVATLVLKKLHKADNVTIHGRRRSQLGRSRVRSARVSA
jgi:single-stranded DNA-binding protein